MKKKQWQTPRIIMMDVDSIHTGNICGTSEGYTYGRPLSAFTHMTQNGFSYCYFRTPGGGSAKKVVSVPTLTATWGTDATNTGACGSGAIPVNCGPVS